MDLSISRETCLCHCQCLNDLCDPWFICLEKEGNQKGLVDIHLPKKSMAPDLPFGVPAFRAFHRVPSPLCHHDLPGLLGLRSSALAKRTDADARRRSEWSRFRAGTSLKHIKYIYIILYTLQVVCCTRCQSLWSVLGAGSLQSVTTMFVSCSIRRSARRPDSWQIRGVDARVGARGTPKARTKWNQDEGQCCSTTSQFRSGWSAGEGSGSMFYATWGYDALMPSMNQSQARVKGRTGSTVMQALRCGR